MPKFKPQYKRLLFIDRKIRTGAYPNCSSLAEEWETSTRTMQRDIDYLKYELDAPIGYDPVKHGFYYSDPTWFLPSVMLSEGDLLAVLIGKQAMNMYEGTPVAEDLQRIYAKLAELLPESISIGPEIIENRFSFFNPPARRVDPDIWRVVLRSLLHQRVLVMQYRSAGAQKARAHEIHPYHVVNLEGDWYVLAYEERWDDLRQFALSRIKEARVTDRGFKVADDFDATEAMKHRFGRHMHAGTRKTVLVRLLVDKTLASFMREKCWHPRQVMLERSGGRVELRIPVADTRDIEPWILSLAEHVKVLAPTKLRASVRTRHSLAAKR